MLNDAEIERYARQVVLPEVGGRGQERLLASRVLVLGDDATSRRTADLLRRAGVRVSRGRTAEHVDVIVDFGTDPADAIPWTDVPAIVARVRGTTTSLTVLPALPCRACDIDTPGDPSASDPLASCGRHALAALAASEALLVLLEPTRCARRYTIDLAAGMLAATTLTLGRCPHGTWSE